MADSISTRIVSAGNSLRGGTCQLAGSETPAAYVYLIQRGHGSVKIGVAKDPEQRCRNLQTANHRKLRVIVAIPCVSQSAAYRLERDLHARLARYRLGTGEWFRKSVIRALRSEFALPDELLTVSQAALTSVTARRREDARRRYEDWTKERLLDHVAHLEWRLEKAENSTDQSTEASRKKG